MITTCEEVGSTTTCTTDDTLFIAQAQADKPSYINGFSYGEIFIIFLLLMILIFFFFSELKNWIFGIKTTDTVKYRIFNE